MTDNPPKAPKVQKTEAERRAERLAEQLRVNLHRRKAQARGMAAGDVDDLAGEAED